MMKGIHTNRGKTETFNIQIKEMNYNLTVETFGLFFFVGLMILRLNN